MIIRCKFWKKNGVVLVEDRLERIKEKIESLREDINRYVQYPDIFKEEIDATSNRMNGLINEYIRLNEKWQI